MNRSKTVIWNTIAALGGYVLQILMNFAVRKIFIMTLGVAYLGYNSVFSNILQLLNLADLGIGVAITSFLYKPLAEKDNQRISALMGLYKQIYEIIGIIIFIIGIIISVFLDYLIPDSTVSIWYLRLLFYLNLVATVSTYFLAYKRTLIIADQKSYLANITDTIVFFVLTTAQIVCLLVTPDYVIFLILALAKNVISNIVLSIKCNKLYGKVDRKAYPELANEYKPQVIQYVKDVFISRVGAVVYYGTDNVIISVLKGSLLTGFLSNYTMITGYLTLIVNQVLNSLQATFGNYVSSGTSSDEQRRMTDNYFCANFLVGNFCMICFIMIVQPFVNLYFGAKLLLSFTTACWLGINLMLSMLIQLPSQVFTIYRLFKYDRPIIVTSALLNIVISIVLVNMIGIDGALIGTFVTSLIYLFSRFYIIATKVYTVKYWHYIKRILFYFSSSVLSFFITYYSTNGLQVSGWGSFILKAAIVAIIAFSSSCAFLCWQDEFKFLINKIIPTKVRRYVNPASIIVITVLCSITAFVIGGYFR